MNVIDAQQICDEAALVDGTRPLGWDSGAWDVLGIPDWLRYRG